MYTADNIQDLLGARGGATRCGPERAGAISGRKIGAWLLREEVA